MTNIALTRIKKEFQDVMKSEEVANCNIKVELKNDNYTELKGQILGPPDTPYEGGLFELDIKIPSDYPFNPPKVQFCTKIWHPNVSSQTGAICLDILKDQWAAAMTLRTVLLSIQALLSAAEPDDPQDAIVAKQYLQAPEIFKRTARHWTNVYAHGSKREIEFDQKIQQLITMGFEEHRSRTALSFSNWNVESAMEYLLS